MYIQRLVYQHILPCPLRGPRSNVILVSMSTPSYEVLVSNTIFNKRNQGSLEKQLILGLGQEICKINLKHLVVPESKDVCKQKNVTHNDGAMSKEHRS